MFDILFVFLIFIIISQLGKGSFADVYLGTDKEKQSDVAIKLVVKGRIFNRADRVGLKQEIEILQKLDHGNIIRLHRVFDEPNYCYLITELMEGGNLFDKLKKKKCFSEKDARVISKTLFETMDYCHGQKIAHRDLKPQNVLLKVRLKTNHLSYCINVFQLWILLLVFVIFC